VNRKKRLIVYGLYFLLNFIGECIILHLFPNTGLGGLICFPTTIVLSLVLGFILYALLKLQIKKWSCILLIVAFIIVQTLLQLALLPQEFRGSSFKQISNAFSAYKNYDRIKLSDFPKLTDAERVVFIYKFKSQLPLTYTSLTIDSINRVSENVHSHTYEIKKFKTGYSYDTTKLNIIESDSSTIIKQYLNSDTLMYRIYPNFIKNSGGYVDHGIYIYTREDKLKIDHGIDVLFYNILRYTKSPHEK